MRPTLHTCGGDLVKQHLILIKWGDFVARMVPTTWVRVSPRVTWVRGGAAGYHLQTYNFNQITVRCLHICWCSIYY